MYVERRRPLKQVMQEIETKFQFKKSERNWKTKLKEWGFDKNLTGDIKFMVKKAEKRALDEGKETEFTRNGVEVPAETIHQFKKPRVKGGYTEIIDLDIGTPPNITYTTPNAGEAGHKIATSSPKAMTSPPAHSYFDDVTISLVDDIPHETVSVDQVSRIAASSLKVLFELFLGIRQPYNISSCITCFRDVAPLCGYSGLFSDQRKIVELMNEEIYAASQYYKPRSDSLEDDPGLIRERMLLRLLAGFLQFSSHSILWRIRKEICNAFMESATACSLGDRRGSIRLAFARALGLNGLSTESLHQFIEAFYECLLLDKTEPSSANSTLIIELINRLRSDPEIRPLLDSGLMEFPNLDVHQLDSTIGKRLSPKLIYPVAALAAFSFRKGWNATGQRLLQEIRTEISEEPYENGSPENRIVLYLEIFTHYRGEGDGEREATTAESIISAAYAITRSIWKAERTELENDRGIHDYRWQRAWMKTYLPLYLDPRYRALVEQLRDCYPFLVDLADELLSTEETGYGSSSSELESSVSVPLKIPLMTFEEEMATYRPSGGVILAKTNASVNTSSNQRSSKYGITYTESLSAFSGLSLDYKALFPHSDR